MATYHFSVKSGKRGKAREHADYIAREGKYGKNGKQHDLIAKDHGNLPAWAHDDPAYFWKMADKHERANGAAYREFELALPLELTLEQNLDLVKEFVDKELKGKAYQVAIHQPKSALGKVDQPHAHAMFSDRVQDDIERLPEQHFKRFNQRNPEQGGCRKDSGGKEPGVLKSELIRRREDWANLQNAHLEKYGHVARVDHRSHRERGIERDAERHLGNVRIVKMDEKEKSEIRAKRKREDFALCVEVQT